MAELTKEPIFPTQLKQTAREKLTIQWSDGHTSEFQVRNLRLECRCAACVDEWTREPILKPSDIPSDIVPRQIQSVGRYALNFVWSDGHSTGYYPFEILRKLCECPLCLKPSTS